MAHSTATNKDENARAATREDFQAVLDIEPHGYDGIDYLPATYSSLVEGPAVKGYVYEKKGKVVGFLSAQLVDNGQTLVTSAGRIKQQSRGGGMYGRFKQRVFAQWRESPRLKFLFFASSNLILDKFGGNLLKSYEVIMEKTLTSIQVKTDAMRSMFSTSMAQTSRELRTLSRRDVSTMLNQPPSHLRHLFPQERILLNWHPYRIMFTNTDFIFSSNNRVFVANAEELSSAAIIENNVGEYPLTLLSCGSHYPCERGRTYDVDVFGTGCDADLRMHLEWHLRHLNEIGQEKVGVMKVFYRRSVGDVVNNLQTEYPVELITMPFQNVFVLQADFESVLHKCEGTQQV